MNEITALLRRDMRKILSLHQLRQELGFLRPRRGPLPEPNHAETLISGMSSLQNLEKETSAVYKPPNLWYFVIAS